MNQPDRGSLAFRVVYPGECREFIKQVLLRAANGGRLAEIAKTLRGLHARLEWIPLDFGDPLRDLPELGLLELIGCLPPFVVTYAVDEVRRLVYISRSF